MDNRDTVNRGSTVILKLKLMCEKIYKMLICKEKIRIDIILCLSVVSYVIHNNFKLPLVQTYM